MKKIYFIFILVTSIILMACSSVNTSKKSTELLFNKSFTLVEPFENDLININFDEKRVYGHSGVNRFFGPYHLKDDSIQIGPLASTMMAGPQKDMDNEQMILKTLNSATSYSYSNNLLIITSSNGEFLKFKLKENK